MTIRDVVSASGTFAANNGTSKQKRFSFLYDMDIISIIFWTGNTISFLTFRGGENTTRDIHEQIKDIYGVEISAEMVSRITDHVVPEIKEWQNRPLEKIYPFVFMDAMHYKVRDNGQVINKAVYVVMGINLEGYKDILGIWIGENESSKFWLGVLNELKNRGIEDILLFCVDGLTGMKEAINATFPNAEIQRCIIHQLRNSFKNVSYKDLKAFSKDFKTVYTAPGEEAALDNFVEVKNKWGKHYPFAFKNWENNWDVLSPFYKYPNEIRKIIYTTNIIEGVNRQFRKVTKTKSVFPSDASLEKILFLAAKNVMKKWTQRYRNWDQVLNQLMIMYEDRVFKSFIKLPSPPPSKGSSSLPDGLDLQYILTQCNKDIVRPL